MTRSADLMVCAFLYYGSIACCGFSDKLNDLRVVTAKYLAVNSGCYIIGSVVKVVDSVLDKIAFYMYTERCSLSV